MRHDVSCAPGPEQAENTREGCLLWGMRLCPCLIATNRTSGASEDLAELSAGITLEWEKWEPPREPISLSWGALRG